MKHEIKTITKEMIRRYFGANARITRRLVGGWRVRTANGGEIKISQKNISPVYGGRDVYRAAVLLANEAWGGGKVHGTAEFKMAMLAHGEAEGVNVRVAERGRWAGPVVAFLIVVVGCNVSGNSNHGAVISGVIALVVWLLMNRAAKRQAQRETDQMGFPFPNTGGDAKEASDEDLKKGGWL